SMSILNLQFVADRFLGDRHADIFMHFRIMSGYWNEASSEIFDIASEGQKPEITNAARKFIHTLNRISKSVRQTSPTNVITGLVDLRQDIRTIASFADFLKPV